MKGFNCYWDVFRCMKKALFTLVCSASFLSSHSKPDMSRLRLAAACALLKLAQEPCYHEIITLEQYQLCALVINVRTTSPNLLISCCFELRCYYQAANTQLYFTFTFPPPKSWGRNIFLNHFISHLFLLIIIIVFCVFLSWLFRMSATRFGSVFLRSSTGAYVASVCRWNTWQCLLYVPRTLLKRGGLTLASAWWKMSTYAESTSNSTLPSAVKKQKLFQWNLNLEFYLFLAAVIKTLLHEPSPPLFRCIRYCRQILGTKSKVRML